MAACRKRSRDENDNEDNRACRDAPEQPDRRPSAVLKRTRTENELDGLGVIPVDQAWPVEMRDWIRSAGNADNGCGPRNYVAGRSLFILCIMENMSLHSRLLWAALPDLRVLEPSLQALVVCRDPAAWRASTGLPVVQAKGYPHNHFVKLGLLHPQGGGQQALDALVLIDSRGRRRLVLPFGWGAGHHVEDAVGGEIVQKRLMAVLRDAIEELEAETAR